MVSRKPVQPRRPYHICVGNGGSRLIGVKRVSFCFILHRPEGVKSVSFYTMVSEPDARPRVLVTKDRLAGAPVQKGSEKFVSKVKQFYTSSKMEKKKKVVKKKYDNKLRDLFFVFVTIML